ncbi:hypothetical protein M513_13368 [Trichuris suis]|uniref:Uncharacterized protein n=1 Tax=Trichuris suis TaxID=68888 RepID=A0A085LLB6_9BILA|nr:hypothetical protein M513_13368 [Trichuris suis]
MIADSRVQSVCISDVVAVGCSAFRRPTCYFVFLDGEDTALLSGSSALFVCANVCCTGAFSPFVLSTSYLKCWWLPVKDRSPSRAASATRSARSADGSTIYSSNLAGASESIVATLL